MRDPRLLKELAIQCRLLTIILCAAYSLALLIFATAMVMAPSVNLTEVEERSPDEYKFDFKSRLHFALLTGISFLAASFCGLFIGATFVTKLWLAIPYMVLHCGIAFYVLILIFIHTNAMILLVRNRETDESWAAFGYGQIYRYGSIPMFDAVLLLALLIYTSFPLYSYVRELSRYLNERRLEDQILYKQNQLAGDSHHRIKRQHFDSDSSRNELGASNPFASAEETSPPGEVTFSSRTDRRESRVFPVTTSGGQISQPSVAPHTDRKKSHHHHHRR